MKQAVWMVFLKLFSNRKLLVKCSGLKITVSLDGSFLVIQLSHEMHAKASDAQLGSGSCC